MSKAARCLVVTGLRLDRLGQTRHGIYQRFRMLLDAAAQAGFALDVVCARPPECADDVATSAHIEQELASHWHIEARVQALLRTQPDRRTPYLLQQLLGCLSPVLSIGYRAAVAGGQVVAVTDALKQRPALVLAHRLPSMSLLSGQADLPPTFFDMDDVEHVVARRRAAQLPAGREKWITQAGIWAIKKMESRAVRRAHRTLVCADDDARLLSRLVGVPPERVMTVPNGVAAGPSRDQNTDVAPVFLMVGIYSYEPNAEGAAFFVREVWPRVQATRPDAQLWLVGSAGDTIPMPSPMPPGVKVMGFVDDLDAVYAEAAVVVCPILTGGGTRVKLIEAAMRGMPIVSTTIGAEGLALAPESEILLRDDPAALAEACLALVSDPSQARALGERAFRSAQALYDRQRIASRLAEAMRSAV